MACVLSSSLFTRVLVIICIIRCVMASENPYAKTYFYPENFTLDCDTNKYYVSETIQQRSCTIDTALLTNYKCTQKGGSTLRFVTKKNQNRILCRCSNFEAPDKCENVKLSGIGDIRCKVNGKIIEFTCYFNGSKEYQREQIYCMASCDATINNKVVSWFITNSTCPFYEGPPTLEPPTTAAPTTTAAPPEKEFPIWAAVVIALGIALLVALLLFLVWRKRRQAQRLAQDAEGGNTGNPEGEEAEGGDNDAEEEEATNAESAEKSEDAEGGEEAPEEQ
ncbi:uncharacterized protein LOC112572546 [Pomacea canaliculata]|uniref:uncharacterized protein LOC112572546 n=1 Tax=Pomacea canaliculata TaxID=400727 RepID=UPI000D73DF9F|nr:uncharacterized protein LOC112572546 [Pomacea canaliculata]